MKYRINQGIFLCFIPILMLSRESRGTAASLNLFPFCHFLWELFLILVMVTEVILKYATFLSSHMLLSCTEGHKG